MKVRILSILLSIVFLTSCSNNKKDKQIIVCTTGMIADLVSNIAPDSVEVISLMGPGVDPHLYKPTSGDIKNLKNANIIFYNGLHLEGKAQEVLEKLANKKPVHAIAKAIPTSMLINVNDLEENYDPHIWHDIDNWMFCLDYVKNILIGNYPDQEEIINQNSEDYKHLLEETSIVVKELINQIPRDKRYLVTAHDAFEYFGRAYQIKVKALQGISTASEFGLKDVIGLSNFISNKEIKAVFIESSVPDKSLRKVIESCKEMNHTVKIGGHLYSDALGDKNESSGTYVGMLIHNAKIISDNLK